MIKIALVTFIITLSGLAQDIVNIPTETQFKFDMAALQKKQSECIKAGDDYRIKNQVHFINGKLYCNGPIFQRSCFVELDDTKAYQSSETCSLDLSTITSHYIEIGFQSNNCPALKCRPLMFTGLFTGPDIGVKSLKYNLGKNIKFNSEEGINLNGKSTLDKTPQMNKIIKSDSEISVQGQ